MMISITIPGDPVAQGRPRVTRFGTYDPEKSRDYKAFVKYCALEVKPDSPLDRPLAVTVRAFFPMPKSKSKRWHTAALLGDERPTKKPDADNIAKIVCDALNGILWKDDSQIVILLVTKRYALEPRVELEVDEAKL